MRAADSFLDVKESIRMRARGAGSAQEGECREGSKEEGMVACIAEERHGTLAHRAGERGQATDHLMQPRSRRAAQST